MLIESLMLLALGYDRSTIPTCDTGEQLLRIRGAIVCSVTAKQKRKIERRTHYTQDKSVRDNVRKVTPREHRPFQTRISDIRSSRARRAAALHHFKDREEVDYRHRIREKQREYHCRRVSC